MQRQYDKSTIHSNNMHQIHTYVTEYDKGHKGNVDGMLLYAKTQEDITPDGQFTHNDGNVFYFRTLDLNMDFESIKKRLDSYLQ
jgi:5-methylcytosine-specific restriction enzyme subunit McrC